MRLAAQGGLNALRVMSLRRSSLFWDPIHKDWTAVAMGAFDGPTHTRLARHIFVADKGDYYDIADGLPQNRR